MSLYATCRCGVPEGQEGAHRTDCPLYGVIMLSGPVCRGSWALGTACGRCERCISTKPLTCLSGTPSLEERLRHNAGWRSLDGHCLSSPGLLTEAADEIASLRARVEVMREALENAAKRFDYLAGAGIGFPNGVNPKAGAQEARQALRDSDNAE